MRGRLCVACVDRVASSQVRAINEEWGAGSIAETVTETARAVIKSGREDSNCYS